MVLSDQQEQVSVTLSIRDWAVVVNALAASVIPIEIKSRLNATIFQSAQDTVRSLS